MGCPLSLAPWEGQGVVAETHDRDAFERPPPWLRASEMAARQLGVLSGAQLREVGIGRGAVQNAVRAGRLHRLHRGVYAVGHRILRPEGHRLAAVLACGPGAVLSHRSAAAHWDLLATSQERIDVTATRGRHRVPGIRLHTSRSVDAQDTTNHQGIPITTVHRTLLDLAATVRPDQLENALAQAMHLQVYDQRAIDDVIVRSNGHRGTRVLQEATEQEPQITKSMWEIRMLALVRRAGLPEPRCNEALHAPDHGECRPDFYWPAHGLIVETDGWEAHRTQAAFRRDRAKDAALTAAGYKVVRFTWDVDDATILRRLRSLLQN
ncbi:MAG TPA: type IV toxin-antitoxin system AbiEi family antitoxin domain-containing protein [Solirubrobacteraceae bacterium]